MEYKVIQYTLIVSWTLRPISRGEAFIPIPWFPSSRTGELPRWSVEWMACSNCKGRVLASSSSAQGTSVDGRWSSGASESDVTQPQPYLPRSNCTRAGVRDALWGRTLDWSGAVPFRGATDSLLLMSVPRPPKNSSSNSLAVAGFPEWCVVPTVWDKVNFIIAHCFP